MKYLLLLSLIGFFSWPYYHRMRTFGWEPIKSYAIALLPSFFIAIGIAKTIIDVSNGTFIDFPHLPDILTKWTYAIVFIIFVGLSCWLMFTAEWCKDTSGPADDGAFFLAICMLAICCAQAFFVTDVIIKVVMAV